MGPLRAFGRPFPNRLLLSQSSLLLGNVTIVRQALVYQAVGRLGLKCEIILVTRHFLDITIICKTVTLLSTTKTRPECLSSMGRFKLTYRGQPNKVGQLGRLHRLASGFICSLSRLPTRAGKSLYPRGIHKDCLKKRS